MSTVDLDAIRDLVARYADATWDEEDGLARDLAAEVPALIAEVEGLQARIAAHAEPHRRLLAEWARLRGELAANEVSR